MIARAVVIAKANVFLGEAAEGRHILLHILLTYAVYHDHQQVITAAFVVVAEVVKRIFHRNGFRIPLLHQPTFIFLRIEQAVFLKEFTRGHWIRQRQVRPLHGDRAIEIGIGPDINQVRGKEGADKQRRQRLAETLAVQAAQLLPAPGAKQHLHQEDHRHTDKHQLPVARQLTLIRVDHQFPHHRIKVKVEMRKDLAVDQQQRQAGGGQRGGDKSQQPLRHHHKGERENNQQVAGENDKAEMPQ
ncbi:hypothetical protein D3C72_1002500 [compost metagenome]